MLSAEELEQRLTVQHSGDRINAFIDEAGNYWISGNGGQGAQDFKKLRLDHPFIETIESMIKQGIITQQPFKYEYWSQQTLARLLPN